MLRHLITDYVIYYYKACSLQFPGSLGAGHQRCEILIMPVLRRLREIDVFMEAAWDLLLLQILKNAKCASLIMIHRIVWALVIRTCAKFNCLVHNLLLYFDGLSNYITFVNTIWIYLDKIPISLYNETCLGN